MKKKVYKHFDYTQCKEFSAFLSDMAAQGWHFKEWTFGLVFERGEPEQVEYAVEIFVRAKEDDLRPDTNTEEFAEYCRVAGWEFVEAKRKFCIFKKCREDAIDIVTPEERMENIKAAEINWLKNRKLTVVWLFILQFLRVSRKSAVVSWAFDGWAQMFLIGLLAEAIVTLIGIAHVKKWNDENRPLKVERKVRIFSCTWMTIVLGSFFIIEKSYIGLGVIIVTFASLFLIDIFIKKFRPSKDNRTLIGLSIIMGMLLVFVIIVSAFPEITESDYHQSKNKGVFGTLEIGYYQYSNSQMIKYTKYRSKSDWILDKVWESETEYVTNLPIPLEDLDVEEIESLADWKYMIRNPGYIVVFEETSDIPAEKLRSIMEEIGIR